MWARLHSSQARKPVSWSRPKSATAALAADRGERCRNRDSGTAATVLPAGACDQRRRHTRPAAWRPARRRAAACRRPMTRGGVADDEDIGMAGHRQIGADLTRPARSVSAPSHCAARRGHDAGRPDDGARPDAPSPSGTPSASQCRHRRAEPHLDAELAPATRCAASDSDARERRAAGAARPRPE